jgi:hypothetical protein
MNAKRIALHSFIMAGLDFASILMAFGLYKILGPRNQILFQAPVAGLLCVVAFVLWDVLQAHLLAWSLLSRREYLLTYLATFFWFPPIFYPLHYLTQGYLADFGNITATWAFQAPVNALALLAAWGIERHYGERVAHV